MADKYTDNIMRVIRFIQKENCSNQLFKYPYKDPNGFFLEKRTVAIYGNNSLIDACWFKDCGAEEVLINPSYEEMTKAKVGVVMPNGGIGYYEVLDYYIITLQKMICSMKSKHNYKHIIVILPPRADEYSCELSRMAHYAVLGLIKGLGKMYAQNGLFVNGIILNNENPLKYLKERIVYLASDNSCNTVGQIFKL